MKVETQIEKEESDIWSFFKSLPSKSKIKKLIELLKVPAPKFRPASMAKFIVLAIFLIFINVIGTPPADPVTAHTITNKVAFYTHSIKDKAKTQLIKEVSDYMYKMVPETKLSPDTLIDYCLKYDMDIIFVLSQGILESHLGTKGKAAKTNSVWNVGTYDDGQILYTYKHPNNSIEPYLKLLTRRYLVDKDIKHLLEDKGYKNDDGKRFASAKNYENALRKFMVRIDMETCIALHQQIVKMSDESILAYFAPPEITNSIIKFDDNLALN